MDEEGTIWWGPPEPERGEPEEEGRHPEKAWADMKDSEPDEDEKNEEIDNGLGQGGLRPDELSDEDKKKVEKKKAKQ